MSMSGTRKPASATRRTAAGAKNSLEDTAAADAGQVEAQAESAGSADVAAPTAGDPAENASADPADTSSAADENAADRSASADADASGDGSPDDDDEDAPDADLPAPCEECFPLGFPQDATSVGCEHGQWSL